MPGFDGTGLFGSGPITGGGRGFCASQAETIPNRPFYGRAFARGFGMGRGRGFRNWFRATGIPVVEYTENAFTQKIRSVWEKICF